MPRITRVLDASETLNTDLVNAGSLGSSVEAATITAEDTDVMVWPPTAVGDR